MNQQRQITRETEHGVEWTEDWEAFENPETLIEWLEASAQPGSYAITGRTIYATEQAMHDAIAGLEQGIAEQQEESNHA